MYINTETQQYPISEREIKSLYPNVSFGIPFTPPVQFSWVFPAPKPEYTASTHKVLEATPMLTVKGHWEQTWDIIPLSQEELDAIAAAIPEETMKITKLAFRNRFTPAEKVVLYTAAKASVELEVYLDDVNAATFIDLKRADTVVAVQSLELLGIIGEGRAAVILDTPAAVHEVFTG